jgi:hypothetical protein
LCINNPALFLNPEPSINVEHRETVRNDDCLTGDPVNENVSKSLKA